MALFFYPCQNAFSFTPPPPDSASCSQQLLSDPFYHVSYLASRYLPVLSHCWIYCSSPVLSFLYRTFCITRVHLVYYIMSRWPLPFFWRAPLTHSSPFSLFTHHVSILASRHHVPPNQSPPARVKYWSPPHARHNQEILDSRRAG